MILLHPIWLVLIIPAGFFLQRYSSQDRLSRALRFGAMALLFLALAGPARRVKDKLGTVVVVIDKSKSMPADSPSRASEMLQLIEKGRPNGAELGIVVFGYKAGVAQFPTEVFRDLEIEVDPHGSNLDEALNQALDLIGKGNSGRILVLSDGCWTGNNPLTAGGRAATRSVAIDYRFLGRDLSEDTGISHLDAPQQVSPNEGFLMTAWVFSPGAQDIHFDLRRGGMSIATGNKHLVAGLNSLVFRDIYPQPATLAYHLTIKGEAGDTIPENNHAEFLVGVRGPRPVLHVSPNSTSSLAGLLQQGGLSVVSRSPEQVNWTLGDLAGYSAVVLENVPAGDIGEPGMAILADLVTETGSGLMITGGKQSYGPGGYFKSPLDPIMPVSMELRREHRKLALAMVIAVDRSGSMAAMVGSGQTKMDLANLASAQVLELLGPTDEFGLLAVDSMAHTVVPMGPIGRQKGAIRAQILQIGAGGGGIFVFEALTHATRMLEASEAGARHLLLFADAADAEEAGNYRELLGKCTKAGITVSVVGLGTDKDVDAALLIDIGERGNGRVYFTEYPEELPRIFAQDTFVVARSTFIEEPTAGHLTAAMQGLTSLDFSDPPKLGGYNLTYLREGAEMPMVSMDEYDAPLVASWFAGSGRILCFTGEASGEFSGELVGWERIGDFYNCMARWVAGLDASLPGQSLLTQSLRDGNLVVTLHLDPERKHDPFRTTPQVSLLQGSPGEKPQKSSQPMIWTTPDTLEMTMPLTGDETVIVSVAFDDESRPTSPRETLPPVRLPYPPEYEPPVPEKGITTLAELARISTGMERAQLDRIWQDLPVRENISDFTPLVLALLMLIFLVEILQRRTGYLEMPGPRHWWKATRGRPIGRVQPSSKQRAGVPTEEKAGSSPQESQAEVETPAGSRLQDALSKASNRARKRTEKK